MGVLNALSNEQLKMVEIDTWSSIISKFEDQDKQQSPLVGIICFTKLHA